MADAAAGEVTVLLRRWSSGDEGARDELFPIVYDELRRLAGYHMRSEAPGALLQPTALVHEAYLRLVGQDGAPPWSSANHFFAAAAEAMRRILIEHARRKNRLRHGGAREQVEFDEMHFVVDRPVDELVAVDDALDQLKGVDSEAADLVKLRCDVEKAKAFVVTVDWRPPHDGPASEALHRAAARAGEQLALL